MIIDSSSHGYRAFLAHYVPEERRSNSWEPSKTEPCAHRGPTLLGRFRPRTAGSSLMAPVFVANHQRWFAGSRRNGNAMTTYGSRSPASLGVTKDRYGGGRIRAEAGSATVLLTTFS